MAVRQKVRDSFINRHKTKITGLVVAILGLLQLSPELRTMMTPFAYGVTMLGVGILLQIFGFINDVLNAEAQLETEEVVDETSSKLPIVAFLTLLALFNFATPWAHAEAVCQPWSDTLAAPQFDGERSDTNVLKCSSPTDCKTRMDEYMRTYGATRTSGYAYKSYQAYARCDFKPATTTPPSTPTEIYAVCGVENALCAGSGYKRVCYAASVAACTDADASNDRKAETDLPTSCTNARFGSDPAPQVVKTCYVSNVVLTPPPQPPTTQPGAGSLSWLAPTQNVDGSALTNLAGFRIYYGTAASALTRSIAVPNALTTSYVVGDLASGTWYFAVRAYTTNDAESSNSNIVTKVIP